MRRATLRARAREELRAAQSARDNAPDPTGCGINELENLVKQIVVKHRAWQSENHFRERLAAAYGDPR